MATHGRGGLSRVWLGSVATGFLERTDKPLILVRPEDGESSEPFAQAGFAKLLVPLDGTELSEGGLAHAIAFGELFDAAFHLTRVVKSPMDVGTARGETGGGATPVEIKGKRALDYLEAHAERMRAHGLDVSTSVVFDAQAGRGILEAVAAEGCDSIAMATRGRGRLGRAFLGSAADKVLRGTEVPLLLPRPDSSTD